MSAATWPQLKPSSAPARKSPQDARTRKRLKVSLPVHVRPFDARFAEIEDVGQVVDFTRDGLYFKTSMPHYFVGMRLIVTFPFRREGLGAPEIPRFGRPVGAPRERQPGDRGSVPAVKLCRASSWDIDALNSGISRAVGLNLIESPPESRPLADDWLLGKVSGDGACQSSDLPRQWGSIDRSARHLRSLGISNKTITGKQETTIMYDQGHKSQPHGKVNRHERSRPPKYGPARRLRLRPRSWSWDPGRSSRHGPPISARAAASWIRWFLFRLERTFASAFTRARPISKPAASLSIRRLDWVWASPSTTWSLSSARPSTNGLRNSLGDGKHPCTTPAYAPNKPGMARSGDRATLVRLIQLMITKGILTEAEGSSVLIDPLL